jgi:hypothetical protein
MRTTDEGRGTTGDGRLSCEQVADRLADFLERELDERTRGAVEAHALDCADCGPLLADLRKLRIDAANLPELAPSRDLWSGIAARIEAPVIELPGTGDGRWATGDGRLTSSRRRRVWMGLAAAGLVAVTAGVTYVTTKQFLSHGPAQTVATESAPTRAPVAALTPDSVAAQDTTIPPTVADPIPMVAAADAGSGISRPSPIADRRSSPLENEIARLKAIVSHRRAQLDPTTLSIVDRNLVVIDSAIAQVRQALLKDPESRFLMESLDNALENKVEILRTAAMLPSRT